MTKRKKKTDVPAVPVVVKVQSDGLRRVALMISEADWSALQQANGNGATVTAFMPKAGKALSEAQRASRKAYRLRPEVKEKQRAYRSERAKRIRAAKAAAKASAAAEQPTVVMEASR